MRVAILLALLWISPALAAGAPQAAAPAPDGIDLLVAAIQRAVQAGDPLALRALAYATSGPTGYIIGAYGLARGEPDVGKFTLTLRRGGDGRWLIVSDMDNGNGRPVPTPSAPYQFSDVDTAHGDREFHLLWPDGAPGAVGAGAAGAELFCIALYSTRPSE